MKYTYIFLLLPLGLASCNFNKSVSTNLNTGLTTKGNGLSCDDVKLVINDEEITRNEFQYAEKLEMYFESMKGFVKKDGVLRFGMRLLIRNKQGDTVLFHPDIYADAEPTGQPQPTLKPFLAIGRPMSSGKEYTFTAHIWDKNGKGTFDVKLPFSVTRNSAIQVETSAITCNEYYLTNPATEQVISGNEVKAGSRVDINFQGMSGFQIDEQGLCYVYAELIVRDENGNELFRESDMLNGMEISGEQLQDAFMFYVSLPQTKGKLTVTTILRDKVTGRQMKAKVKLVTV